MPGLRGLPEIAGNLGIPGSPGADGIPGIPGAEGNPGIPGAAGQTLLTLPLPALSAKKKLAPPRPINTRPFLSPKKPPLYR